MLEEDDNKNYITSGIGMAIDRIRNLEMDGDGLSFDACSDNCNLNF